MSLEEEARQMAAQIAAAKAAKVEREARDQDKRVLEQTPTPPSWTTELIAVLDGRYPDHAVYHVAGEDKT